MQEHRAVTRRPGSDTRPRGGIRRPVASPVSPYPHQARFLTMGSLALLLGGLYFSSLLVGLAFWLGRAICSHSGWRRRNGAGASPVVRDYALIALPLWRSVSMSSLDRTARIS